jgi:hypothetical protein
MSNIPLRTLRRTRRQNARTEGYTPLQDTPASPRQDADFSMHSTIVTASSAAARRNLSESKGKRKAKYIDDNGEEEMLLGGQELRDDTNTDEELAKGRLAAGLGREGAISQVRILCRTLLELKPCRIYVPRSLRGCLDHIRRNQGPFLFVHQVVARLLLYVHLCL